MKTMSITMVNSDGDEIEIAIPSKWVICEDCRGHGKSSAYLGAFTHDDMQEEGPEFVEDYIAGNYDRPCDTCGGSGKELVPDLEQCTSDEQRAALAYKAEQDADRAQERYTRMRESGNFEGGY